MRCKLGLIVSAIEISCAASGRPLSKHPKKYIFSHGGTVVLLSPCL